MAQQYPYKFTDSEVRQAYNTSVIELARHYGYELKQERDVFKVLHQGGLYIFSNGCGWYCHSTGEKGNGIDFLMKYCGIDSKREAIRIVLDHAHITPAAQLSSFVAQDKPKGDMTLPLKNKETFKHMFAYLIKKRCISPEIVKAMVAENKLYEDFHKNAVFVAYDKDGKPKYATVRGTSNVQYRGEVLNSSKDYPWTMNGISDRVFVFEAPIDAMSHATLTQINNEDWRRDWRISLGGTSDRGLKTFLHNHPDIKTIVFCLDNDYTHTDPRTGKLLNVGQEAIKKHAKTYLREGYKVQKLVPIMPYKDFNEHLVAYSSSLQSSIEQSAQAQSDPQAQQPPAEPDPEPMPEI